MTNNIYPNDWAADISLAPRGKTVEVNVTRDYSSPSKLVHLADHEIGER